MKSKFKLRQIIIPILAVIFVLGACTKDFEEINTDPNSPTDVPAINIFSHVVVDGIDDWLGGGWVNHTYLANWSQQWCKVQYIDEDHYYVRVANNNTFFEGPYVTELMDLQVIIGKTATGEPGEDPALNAAARIFKVWVFHQMTDMFGDIPYFDALQGNVAGTGVFPKYDSQEDIYTDMLNELEEANTALSAPLLNFGGGDLLYGGDPDAWRKFGNSLQLRLLNRCNGAYGGADAKIGQILSTPGTYPIFESDADNAQLSYPGVLPYRNGTYETLYSRTDQAISQTMVNFLKDRSDPRLAVYAQPIVNDTIKWTAVDATLLPDPLPAEWVVTDTTPGDDEYDIILEPAPAPSYFGHQNGTTYQPVLASVSYLGTAIAYDPTAPLFAMTYDEVEFIKAEYYLRTGSDAMAKTAYDAAITANFARWGVADAATYLANPMVDWNGGEAKAKLIGEQKWAAIFGQGVEAYAEVRRTGYPERIFQYELGDTDYPGLGLPVRFPYAPNEESYNPDMLKAAKDAQGISAANLGMYGTQVWWHTKTNPIPTTTDPQAPGAW